MLLHVLLPALLTGPNARANNARLFGAPSLCERSMWPELLERKPIRLDAVEPGSEGYHSAHHPLSVKTFVDAYAAGLAVLEEFVDPVTKVPSGTAVLAAPEARGVFYLNPTDSFAGVSKKDRKIIKRLREQGYTVTFDQAFEEVARACRTMKRRSPPVDHVREWRQRMVDAEDVRSRISENMERVLIEMHRHPKQYAHSAEVWSPDTRLVGGLIFTCIEGTCTGESKFHAEDDVGKLAFQALKDELIAQNHDMIDTVDLLGLVLDTGGVAVGRGEYMRLRRQNQDKRLTFQAPRTR